MRIENKKEHLVIRTAAMEDAPVLTKWWNDGTVMAHAGFPHGLNQTVEETERQIANPTVLSQICIIEANHEKIGEMSYDIEEYDVEEKTGSAPHLHRNREKMRQLALKSAKNGVRIRAWERSCCKCSL